MVNKDNKERRTRKFYEMLQNRHEDAKNHPENLVPLEDILKKHGVKKGAKVQHSRSQKSR